MNLRPFHDLKSKICKCGNPIVQIGATICVICTLSAEPKVPYYVPPSVALLSPEFPAPVHEPANPPVSWPVPPLQVVVSTTSVGTATVGFTVPPT